MEQGRYGIEALARGLKVLELFSPDKPALRFAEIVELSGLSKTTAFRVVKTLETTGYLEREPPDATYRPGLKALTLGFTALSGLDLREIARPHLVRLSRRTDLTTSLSVLHHLEVIYIDRTKNRRIVNLMLGPGARVPAHCTSMGKVLLAGLDLFELGKRLDGAKLEPCTSRTIVQRRALERELVTIREKGYATNDGELAIGLRAVAAAIADSSGATRAAINVAGAKEVIDDRRFFEELPPLVTETARDISAYLSIGEGER